MFTKALGLALSTDDMSSYTHLVRLDGHIWARSLRSFPFTRHPPRA
jgi:hypothetical protein